MLRTLDAPAVRRWSVAAADALAAHRAELDDINVYPVADRDTGTNLALTLRAAADALAADPAATAAAALDALARGAVLGARGNSGVIMSQLLHGLAGALDGERCDASTLAHALRRAADEARACVAEPVEGTILSVADAAADSAAAADGADLAAVLTATVAGADSAVRRTAEQLPALTRAGVVDAGGRGLLLLLDALARVVTGAPNALTAPRCAPRPATLLETARESGSDAFGYEVQYLLHAGEDAAAALRSQLTGLGDSLVVAGAGDGLWNVHVHVNDVGAAIEAGIAAGRPHRISVVRFADQARVAAAASTGRGGVAVVAVAPGEGLAHLFGGEGVHVVDGGAGSPSSADVLAAVRATGAGRVVLLPNASQVAGVAEAAAEQARAEGVGVSVVPTRSPVQGLAAVAVHDPARRFDDDVVAMAEAAAATRFAELTVAETEALTAVGRCQPGDVLGLIDGEVVEIGASVRAVALAVVDRLLGVGGELITILVGLDADPSDVEAVGARIAETAPLVEVAVFDGGQPRYPLLIGVE